MKSIESLSTLDGMQTSLTPAEVNDLLADGPLSPPAGEVAGGGQ